MTKNVPRPRRTAGSALAAMTLLTTGALVAPAAVAAPADPSSPAQPATSHPGEQPGNEHSLKHSKDPGKAWDKQAYRGQVDVVPGDDAERDTLSGVVFDDRDRDSEQDERERGISGVTVSNGQEVVITDDQGRYELPVDENTTVFVTQPAGYQVPVDEDNVAQFHYHHVPEGSPELRYGGLEPTGPVPEAVNFPLSKDRGTAAQDQECVIGGDIQTYTEEEVEFARDGAFTDLAQRSGYEDCGALFVGDIVGDDLSLFPEVRSLSAMINGPARFLPGNHDLDFDATDPDHAFDTYRAQIGPEYYSYDVGEAHVVALSSVEYPFDGDTQYNGAIDDEQMEWLRADLAQVPEDKLIVLASHVPLLGYADQGSSQHQIDQVREIHELLQGREVVSLAGHVHAIENLREGDSLAGWQELFGVEELPFTHITAGAISGDWFNGRETEDGYPLAVQRDGALPGVLTLDLKGTEYRERFTAVGDDGTDQMSLGLNTPAYRDWFEENQEADGDADPFEDPLLVAPGQLDETWLTTNFWMGSTGSTVHVAIDGSKPVEAERTQPMRGEDQLSGAEYSDPAAVQEQLVHGGSVADRTSHLWRLPLPANLEPGEHTAQVTATDVYGREFTEKLRFTVGEPENPESTRSTSDGGTVG